MLQDHNKDIRPFENEYLSHIRSRKKFHMALAAWEYDLEFLNKYTSANSIVKYTTYCTNVIWQFITILKMIFQKVRLRYITLHSFLFSKILKKFWGCNENKDQSGKVIRFSKEFVYEHENCFKIIIECIRIHMETYSTFNSHFWKNYA